LSAHREQLFFRVRSKDLVSRGARLKRPTALRDIKCRLSLRERTLFRGAKDDSTGRLFASRSYDVDALESLQLDPEKAYNTRAGS